MNSGELVPILEANSRRIAYLVKDVSEPQARWKPDPKSWSVLEVINHLYDEERFDFRVRLELLLSGQCDDWPSINPGVWIVDRQYNLRDLAASLRNYLNERRASLAWINNLAAPDWESACQAPWGKLTAGDMFSAWVAHDILHMRQLVELHHAWLLQSIKPYSSLYAGDW